MDARAVMGLRMRSRPCTGGHDVNRATTKTIPQASVNMPKRRYAQRNAKWPRRRIRKSIAAGIGMEETAIRPSEIVRSACRKYSIIGYRSALSDGLRHG